jgi:hypothetical protein
MINRRRLVADKANQVDQGVSRILHHHASPTLPALIKASAGTAVAFLTLAMAACGSASSQAPAPVGLGTSVLQDCTAVSDVLSDGPDQAADPVGYAQAQVLPLRQLTIGDATLHRAVLSLATAYQTFSSSTAATRAAATLAVSKAENEVSKICPQAAP